MYTARNEECLDRTKVAMGSSCPNCREMLLEPMPLNRTVIDIIDKMQLSCEFSKSPTQLGDEQPSSRRRVSENGAGVVDDDTNRTLCGWQGLLSNYREHTNTCGYRLVDCPRGCVDKVPFVLLDQHGNLECALRRVSCSICHGRVKFCDLELHTARLCPEQNVRCEWCHEEMKRKELGIDQYQTGSCTDKAAENRYTGHYNTCPKILLPCEFSSLGCSSLIAREDKAGHHGDMAMAHSLLVIGEKDRVIGEQDRVAANDSKLIMQLSKKLEALLMDNEDLRDQNDRLNMRLVVLEGSQLENTNCS